MTSKKQSLSHDDFLQIKKAAALVPTAHIEQMVNEAVMEIKKFVHHHPRAAFAWSGGKDSLALQYVCELAGVYDCILGISDLEYPAFLSWVTNNMPIGLSVINTHIDIEFLCQNPSMLFPSNSNIAASWFRKIQHRAQRQYFKQMKLDCIILGRRTDDGNYVGKAGKNYYESKGVFRYSPLSKWSHCDVFAVIQYAGLKEPPFYQWPRGYRCGTHAWPARQWCESKQQGWAEIWQIDKNIVHYAQHYIDSAKKFLDTV